MNTVKELLISTNKKKIFSVSPSDSVAKALRKMAVNNLGAILVMEEGKILGLFSERDYARKILLFGKSSLSTEINEVMAKKVIYVTPEYLLDECLALMTRKNIRHLPVLGVGGEVLALLSLEEVVEAILDGKEFMIAELTRYVTGSPVINYEKVKKDNVRELVFIPPKVHRGETVIA
jgi:CBS domain-containing protein